MSNLKGVYYYPLMTREFLNGTRMVSGYINASKIDDLRGPLPDQQRIVTAASR